MSLPGPIPLTMRERDASSYADLSLLCNSELTNLRQPVAMFDVGYDQRLDPPQMGAFGIHSTWSANLKSKYVFGFHHFHAFVGEDGTFDCQELDNCEGRLAYHCANRPPPEYATPTLKQEDFSRSVSFERLQPDNIERLPGFTFFGSPIEPANWGMWLLNGLAGACSYVAAGRPGAFLCYCPSTWQRRLLAFCGVASDDIVEQKPWQTYFCEEVGLHAYSIIDLAIDCQTKALFEMVWHRARREASPNTSEKIFVARRSITRRLGGKYRALVNEDEVIELLTRRGYTIVEPELLTFEQQVCVFRSARVVVGLGGAAMFNTVFCKPATRVLSIEGTTTFILNHARLFASLEHDYAFAVGKEDLSFKSHPHNPWVIDLARLANAVDRFEA